MAHQVSTLVVGLAGKSRRNVAGATFSKLASHPLFSRNLMSLLAMILVLVPSLSGRAQTTTPSSFVPAVVVSSVSAVPVPTPPFPTGQTSYGTGQGDLTPVFNPSSLALDACGNVYELDKGSDKGVKGTNGDTVTEIPANGGFASIVENVGGYENVPLGQDPLYLNVLVGHQYSGGNSLGLVPLTNCVPNASEEKRVGGGSGALFYYYNAVALGADYAGNYYIGTNQTCCVSNNFYLIQETGGNGNIIAYNTLGTKYDFQTFATYNYITADLNQNIYYVEPAAGPAVFELIYSGGTAGTYSAPVQFGPTYTSPPAGVSNDSHGNLYIVDQGNTAIYEVPYESDGKGGGAVNVADQFTITTGLTQAADVPVAVNARGDMYFTTENENAVYKLSLGSANFGAVTVGQTAQLLVNFQFNATVTPATVVLPTGVFGTKSGGNGFAQCTGGTTYAPGGNNIYCQVLVTFTPTAVGKQSSSVVLADASGNAIATAYLEGVGQGALTTLDPGTAQPTASGLKSPTGIAVDQLGNEYIADSANNSVTQFPVGGGAGVPLVVSVATPACGSVSAGPASAFSGPTGVAVDGPGNVYIADTGNNRVVKIPFINGALSVSSATTIGSCFNAPASVFVQINGDVYVTDTGNNQVVWYPSLGPSYGSPITVASGLAAPLATTLDAAGNVFIANSGNNTIEEVPLGGTEELVDAGILSPSAMTTDASGALFVVDQGNFRVLRIPSANGVLSTNDAAEVGFGVANPYGVALDASGNLYVTDSKNSAAYVINRTQVALSFGELAVGSTGDALPLTVESAGTLPLIFTTPYDTVTGDVGDFAITSPTGACAPGITLLPGSSCDLAATFTPTASGARAATLAFNSNSANSAQALLSGTGMALASTTTALAFNFAAGVNAPFYGEPLTFVATVTGSSPTGFVSFVIDGVQAGLLPLASGAVTLPLNSGLTGGAHTIYAVYKGDSANDGSSSAILPITIARAPTTPTLVVTQTPYNYPYSIRHSNAGSCDVLDALGYTNTFNPVPNDVVAFIGTVSSPGIGIPSGTLTWYSDGQLINGIATKANPNPAPSVSTVLPAPGNTFQAGISTNADTLGDGQILGENNTLLGPHNITAVYSGDQNYLPSTSVGTQIIVVDVGPTTPVILPEQPVNPAPYCDPKSSIKVSEPADPSSFVVQSSSPTVTATAAQPGNIVLTLSSLGGWTGSVQISCPNLPQYTTCTPNPGQSNVAASSPGNVLFPKQVTLTFTTNVPPYIPTANQGRLYWLPAVLLGFALLYSRRRFRQSKGNLAVLGVALLLFGGMLGFSGCGSSTSSSSSTATKPGSYPITVVVLGSQVSHGPDSTQYNEAFRPDVPYNLPITLNVK